MSHGLQAATLATTLFLLLSMSWPGEAAVQPGDDSQVFSSASYQDSPRWRTALRLQRRLREHYGARVQAQQLVKAIDESRELFKRTVTVNIRSDDGAPFIPWTISLHEHAYWLKAEVGPAFTFRLDRERIAASLANSPPPSLLPPVPSVITSVHDDRGILKADTDAAARAGYVLDAQSAAEAIASAFETGARTIFADATYTQPPLGNASGLDLGELALLASGTSDFAGSGFGRKHNVQKGLEEKLHNVIVPAGATFSFNDAMHGMNDPGWEIGLGIFNASELRPIRGGGVCQVATTLYRSLLQAGLPVTERAPHSLFVHYYEQYGVGIDATVYPGEQDLAFINDTGHPLVIQSYAEGERAFVNVFGTSDGRAVTLAGPYFAQNDPGSLPGLSRRLLRNEIAWVQTVTHPDGQSEEHIVLSRYKSLPAGLASTHAGALAMR